MLSTARRQRETLLVAGMVLTRQDVKRIRMSERPFKDIAERYGITQRAVADLKSGDYPNQAEFEGRLT